jgi:hypothetical protein
MTNSGKNEADKLTTSESSREITADELMNLIKSWEEWDPCFSVECLIPLLNRFRNMRGTTCPCDSLAPTSRTWAEWSQSRRSARGGRGVLGM